MQREREPFLLKAGDHVKFVSRVTMAALSILRPGMFTTVQDLGRWGFQSRGVPVSGALDWYSHRLANRLLGNDRHMATLEVTLMGPHMRFEAAAAFAVTGAEFRSDAGRRAR